MAKPNTHIKAYDRSRVFAVRLCCTNDNNGNPRRGWMVYRPDTGRMIGFVDEGYTGTPALMRRFPRAVLSCYHNITPAEYRDCLGRPVPSVEPVKLQSIDGRKVRNVSVHQARSLFKREGGYRENQGEITKMACAASNLLGVYTTNYAGKDVHLAYIGWRYEPELGRNQLEISG